MLSDQPKGFVPIARLRHHLHSLDRLQQGSDPRPHQGVIVSHEHSDGLHDNSTKGIRTRTWVPLPAPDSMTISPPSERTRSVMPRSPRAFPAGNSIVFDTS